MCWDISIISTFKEVFAEINKIAEPVGIILFGADSEFKKQVCSKFSSNIKGIAEIEYTEPGLVASANHLIPLEGWNILVNLSGDQSIDHAKRHEAVTELKKVGVKILIGVYVKQRLAPPQTRRFNQQVANLLERPPTADGLNHLIIISEQ